MNKATVTAEPGKQYVIIERTFDAPRDKVFAAMTQKDKVEKWWTGPGYGVRVDQLDARDGGSWKFANLGKNGEEYNFHGTFHEVSPERTIQTFEFDGLPERGHVSLDKMELTETPDGKTKMVITSTYMSVADRDGMIQSGMEQGMQETYRQLDKVLAAMA